MTRIETAAFRRLKWACWALLLGACAGRVPISGSGEAEPYDHVSTLRLPFVTTRSVERGIGGLEFYGEQRGPLSAGSCFLAIDSNTAKLVRIARSAPHDVIAGLGDRSTGRLFIYVHGYAEGFGKSCRRAGLLTNRLRLDDRLLLFTWPANSNSLTYAPDIADLEWSLPHLERVLADLASIHGARRINVIAHSLGTRGVVDVLTRMSHRGLGTEPYGELILIAPDIDRDRFVRELPLLRSIVSGITVFVSDTDKPLRISRTVNESPRLGRADDVSTGVDGVQFVDVSPTGTNSFSGHLYHLYNPAVAEDLRRIIGTNAGDVPAAFQRSATDRPGYWRLVPAAIPD